ncbi:MAG: hypothetical protein OEY09_02690 [Gammaproteobacteria bacterium]|nr:hypothetical protein [Gammaproteobacteria bacterium]
MVDWIYNNEALVGLLLAVSVVSFLATLIAVPVLLVRMPEDYFFYPDRHRVAWNNRHPLLRIPLFVIKNLLGVIFMMAGILMLVLPGQGILTIIIGLVLMEFPGKYHVERWVICRASVMRLVNWIRIKAGKSKLALPTDDQN